MEKKKSFIPATRPIRVRRQRPANTLCPCKSGRKWKRCHGRTFLPNAKDPLSVFEPEPEQRLPETVCAGGAEAGAPVEDNAIQ